MPAVKAVKKTTLSSKSSSKSKTKLQAKKSLTTSRTKKTSSLQNSQNVDNSLTEYSSQKAQYNKNLSKAVRGSVRLFGAPHQLLPHNDPRIGTNKSYSGLGQLYAEKIVLEAPIVHFKPGKVDFMPGKNSSMKKGMLNALGSAVTGDFSALETIISEESPTEDVIKYFGFKEDFGEYMNKVNLLCRFMAYFLGISDTRVPWAKHVTFGHYDWRYYKFKKTMDGKAEDMGSNSKGVGAFIRDVFESMEKSVSEDDRYVSFYVDSGASFSESMSNQTQQSAIKQFTDNVQGIAKELGVFSGISGWDAQGLASSVGSSLDSFAQKMNGNGALTGFLKRLTGTTGQILQGANFMVPEIWSDSEYSRSYTIPITLSTPYGNKLSWYINIGVPLCFILGFILPHGTTANTYTSPHIIQCFSQGWFNCGMAIVKSASIDKNEWNAVGLPNEVKISLNVEDLYSALSLPKSDSPLSFMQNTGMLEFLLINSAADLTVSKMSDNWNVWKFAFSDILPSKVQAAPYDVLMSLRSKVNNMSKLLK